MSIRNITIGAPSGGSGPECFASYRASLSTLLVRLGKAHPRYPEALVYEHRLNENLAVAAREGDTETRRAERAAVIDRLNTLALETTGGAFNRLCEGG